MKRVPKKDIKLEDLEETKYSELNTIKAKLLKEQEYKCAISGKKLNLDKEAVVDHQHKLFKNQPLGEDGAGLIRGVLDFRVNAWEGRVKNSFKRAGLHKFDMPYAEMLRKLADYVEKDPTNLIHPSEKPKTPKLKKSLFNKINKQYQLDNPSKKPLEYPKSGKVTKKIKELSIKYKIDLT